jgi:hypothetical protein
MTRGHEKSRSAIVAVKPTNKAARSAAESVERRAETKGNADQQRTRRTQRRISVSKMLARIRQIVAVDARGGSRMRESRTYGSVRGARGNSRPYRDRREFISLIGSAASWPFAADGQQGGLVRRVGWLAPQNFNLGEQQIIIIRNRHDFAQKRGLRAGKSVPCARRERTRMWRLDRFKKGGVNMFEIAAFYAQQSRWTIALRRVDGALVVDLRAAWQQRVIAHAPRLAR